MECPSCHTRNPSGQKFCGSCGRKLETECAKCGESNPPDYKFCGQCGASLVVTGVIVLAPSGLINSANPKALELLGYPDEEMRGKPFSLFVERDDLVVFFSHWNELRSPSRQHPFEIALKHKDGRPIYLMLNFEFDTPAGARPSQIRVLLNETTDSRKVSSQLQLQEDLLNLVFNTTDAVSTTSKRHMDRSIEDTLKKICLVTRSDRSFIYRFNRQQKRLEPAYQWVQTSSSTDESHHLQSLPLDMLKRAIVRLRNDQAYVVSDVAKLPPAERYELLTWHQTDLGALVCHLIYADKRPIGIIGIAKNKSKGEWTADCIALVKFFGQLLSEKLPFSRVRSSAATNHAPHHLIPDASEPQPRENDPKVINITQKLSFPKDEAKEQPDEGPDRHPIEEPVNLPDMTRPMVLEKLESRENSDQQPVFPRDDGLVLLTCPRCGLQESVSSNQFERLGNALSVTCTCRKRFTAVFEKRRAFRKPVKLAGHFSLKEKMASVHEKGSVWGLMVVRDLSKAGLRFTTSKAELVRPGDQLMVRFHLDNSNRALIHKPARVVSVSGKEVGCRFEGDDSYDITLGFYFI